MGKGRHIRTWSAKRGHDHRQATYRVGVNTLYPFKYLITNTKSPRSVFGFVLWCETIDYLDSAGWFFNSRPACAVTDCITITHTLVGNFSHGCTELPNSPEKFARVIFETWLNRIRSFSFGDLATFGIWLAGELIGGWRIRLNIDGLCWIWLFQLQKFCDMNLLE